MSKRFKKIYIYPTGFDPHTETVDVCYSRFCCVELFLEIRYSAKTITYHQLFSVNWEGMQTFSE